MSDRPTENSAADPSSPNASVDAQDPMHPAAARRVGRRAVIAVIRRGNRWLVIRRSEHVVAPGKLCLPGGKVDPGETEAQTLRREMKEELGVDVLAGRCIWRSRTPWGTQLAWWTAKLPVDSVLRPDPSEVAEARWMTGPEIMAQREECLPSLPEFLEREA